MRELARRLSLSLEAAAWGVIRVANSNMERAIRTISIERGYDPREFTLVAFGGAGPLHACDLASTLRIPRVLIPPHPGVLSALGMILADVVKDYSQTVMLPASRVSTRNLDRLFAPLYERARADLCAEGFADEQVTLLPTLDMRYVGQSFELTIPMLDDGAGATGSDSRVTDRFHRAHLQRFSYASESEPVEIVNLRLKAVGQTAKPRFSRQPLGDPDPRGAFFGHRATHFAEKDSPHTARPIPTALYQRDRLAPGNVVVGPAILFQLDTTTVIPPSWAATVDGWGNLIVESR
jgi:N-methylhydantoinase A